MQLHNLSIGAGKPYDTNLKLMQIDLGKNLGLRETRSAGRTVSLSELKMQLNISPPA